MSSNNSKIIHFITILAELYQPISFFRINKIHRNKDPTHRNTPLLFSRIIKEIIIRKESLDNSIKIIFTNNTFIIIKYEDIINDKFIIRNTNDNVPCLVEYV
jgi:hypothetical protein